MGNINGGVLDGVRRIGARVRKLTVDSTATLAGPVSLTAQNTWALDSFNGGDDQKMASALAQVAAAGGGTIVLGARAHTFANQWATTYVSSSSTTGIRILGGGVAFNGAWSTVSAATACTFTYSGSGAACMDWQHNGTIELAGIQFKSANLGVPLFQTTNATPNIHDCIFSGGGAGASCATDAIVLGGTGTTVGSGDTAPYQGYQGNIYRNFFDGIRRCVNWQSFANSVQVYSNTISSKCGSNLFQGAPFELTGTSGSFCSGNAIYGNCIEVTFYSYAVKAHYCGDSTFGPNGLFDMSANWIAGYYLDLQSSSNEIIDGCRTAVTKPLAFDAAGGGNNRQRNMQRGSGQFEWFHQAVGFYNSAGPPQTFYFGEHIIGVNSNGDQSYWRTDAISSANPYPTVSPVTIAATQFTDGNTVSGSKWVTSATAAFTLTDTGQAIGGTGIPSTTQIVYTFTTSTAFAWQASTAYIAGDIVRPTAANAHLYQCTTAGTTGTSAPTWPTSGGTVTDGTAVWTDRGAGTAAFMTNAATVTNTGVTIGISRAGGVTTSAGPAFGRGHMITGGTAPTIAAGAGAGTSPTVSIAGFDMAHTVTLTTGTAPASGLLCTITFNIAYSAAPRIAVTPSNANAPGVMNLIYATKGTTTYTLTATSALAASTTYTFDVLLIQ